MRIKSFQHTAACRRLGAAPTSFRLSGLVSTHSRLKAAGAEGFVLQPFGTVSTHSRLKAAGQTDAARRPFRCCFNTQPPEGGWDWVIFTFYVSACFNTQPPEGGWSNNHTNPPRRVVSTHSRLKAAGVSAYWLETGKGVSTHSRLKAAGLITQMPARIDKFQHTAA